MKTLRKILLAAALIVPVAFGSSSCHELENMNNDNYGNFDALWRIIDSHYCFFEEKGIDWEEIGESYRAKIRPDMGERELFDLCSRMLAELRDGHTNLISWFETSYYRKWWSDYPQNFDWRLVQEHYLDFNYTSGGAFSYKALVDGKVGYCRYASFSSTASGSFIDEMMLSLRDCTALVLDLRDNSGGELTNVERLTSHFIADRICAGYISHKTGPGHNDFSEPYAYYYDPAQGVRWLKPVIVLTNRSTYSAANNCVQVLKNLPHVLVVGDTTGGGSGMPFSSSLPNGWAVRFSATPVYDADMNVTENGIEPDVFVDMKPADALVGKDTILDVVIEAVLSSDDGNDDAQARSQSMLAFIKRAVAADDDGKVSE